MDDLIIAERSSIVAISDAIRAKTGNSELLSLSDMPTQIASITGGGTGGGSDDVRYVTFMSYDGSIEYGKKAVAVGDDCADPIARGIFSTPIRESTEQYNYTFYGWATTPNGAADSNVLKAVTEDRTVYAVYTASTRYYTVRYFDGETLLKEERIKYGGTAVYTPEKEGYGFDGWEPSDMTITQDIDFYAQWTELITFANIGWSKLNELCESGEAASTFAIGDTRPIIINGANYLLQIVAFNHDTKTNGTGTAGMTVIAAPATREDALMCVWGDGKYNPLWADCKMRTWLRGTFFGYLEEDLRSIIKTVNKTTCTMQSDSNFNNFYPRTETTTENIFLPSVPELNATYKKGEVYNTPETLGAYPGLDTAVERALTTANYAYATRSAYSNSLYCVYPSTRVTDDTDVHCNGSLTNSNFYVVAMFCI